MTRELFPKRLTQQNDLKLISLLSANGLLSNDVKIYVSLLFTAKKKSAKLWGNHASSTNESNKITLFAMHLSLETPFQGRYRALLRVCWGFALLIGQRGWGISSILVYCLACRGERLVHFSSYLCSRGRGLNNFSIEVWVKSGAREWFPGIRPSKAFFLIPPFLDKRAQDGRTSKRWFLNN